MSDIDIALPLHAAVYPQDLAGHLDAGLDPKFEDSRPHALHCAIPEGRHPRLVDFGTWRCIGSGSHQTIGISAEAEETRSALSVAAFQIGDSGGFLGALPRDKFKNPAYYFMTHAILAFDRATIGHVSLTRQMLEELPEKLHVFQTRGDSAHGALQAQTQLQVLLDTLFRPRPEHRVSYFVTPGPR